MRRHKLIKVGFFLFVGMTITSCKTVSPTASTTKHTYGRTYVRPEVKLQDCKDGTTFPEAIAYLKALSQKIMTANPTTFGYDYPPEKFCFEVVDIPGINASSDPGTRKITIRADLLRMGVDGDAPIAAILAHELAHITMQHRRREPVAEDLPKDIDIQELNRRRASQKEWKTKVHGLRVELVNSAINAKFIENAAKIVRDRTIWDRIAPAFREIDKASYKNASEDIIALDKEFGSAIDSPLDDPFKTWRFLDLFTLALDDLASSVPEFSAFIQADPLDCAAANICDDARTFQTLVKYINDVVKPSIEKTCNIKLNADDDPQKYAPWVQWMEQQADEVGFEFYLRAKFLPANYTTFIETMMKADDRYKTCLENLKLPGWKAPRIIDEFVDGHPPYCFRYEDITVQEMLAHAKDYAHLIPHATIVNLPELQALRAGAINSAKELR